MRGTKRAQAAADAGNAGRYDEAVKKFREAIDLHVKDGEIVEVSGVVRQLVGVQRKANRFDDALASIALGLPHALMPEDREWSMVERAELVEESRKPAGQAWREAAALFKPSATRLACLAHAAGNDIEHGLGGVDVVRALLAECGPKPSAMQLMTIAGNAGLSAHEYGVPFLAQAVWPMIWNRGAFGRDFFRTLVQALESIDMTLATALCGIGTFDEVVGLWRAVPKAPWSFQYSAGNRTYTQTLASVEGWQTLAKHPERQPKGPLHDWLFVGAQKVVFKQAMFTKLAAGWPALVPEVWAIAPLDRQHADPFLAAL
jgi:hypothetical protein